MPAEALDQLGKDLLDALPDTTCTRAERGQCTVGHVACTSEATFCSALFAFVQAGLLGLQPCDHFGTRGEVHILYLAVLGQNLKT